MPVKQMLSVRRTAIRTKETRKEMKPTPMNCAMPPRMMKATSQMMPMRRAEPKMDHLWP